MRIRQSKFGGLIILATAAAFGGTACNDDEDAELMQQGGADSVGGTGGSGAAGEAGPGGVASGSGGEPSDAGSAGEANCSPNGGISQPDRIGFLEVAALPLDAEGVIESVTGDRLTVATDEASLDFVWLGSPLSDYFSVGEPVQINVRSPKVSGLGYQTLSTVVSEAFTLVALEANALRVMGTEPGSQATLTLDGLPELRYELRMCCGSSAMIKCDYSDLTAVAEDSEVLVGIGETAEVGAWSVSNWFSTYMRSGESVWVLRATFVQGS